MRIFTPGRELPFAGHPTIGTAILLARAARACRATASATPSSCSSRRSARSASACACATGSRRSPSSMRRSCRRRPAAPPSRDRIADALGLLPREIGFENHTRAVHHGRQHVRLHAGATASKRSPGRASTCRLWAASVPRRATVGGVYLYTRECVHNGSAFHARMFAPQLGVPEDPATGSAAVCFAGVVHDFDGLPDGHAPAAHRAGLRDGPPEHHHAHADRRAADGSTPCASAAARCGSSRARWRRTRAERLAIGLAFRDLRAPCGCSALALTRADVLRS